MGISSIMPQYDLMGSILLVILYNIPTLLLIVILAMLVMIYRKL